VAATTESIEPAPPPEPARLPRPAPERPVLATTDPEADAAPGGEAIAPVVNEAAVAPAAVEPAPPPPPVAEVAPDDTAGAAAPQAPAGVQYPGSEYYVFDDGLDFDDRPAVDAASPESADYCTRFPTRCRLLGAGYDSRDGSDGGGRGDSGGGGGGGGGDPDG
jgi:hypothetical protein